MSARGRSSTSTKHGGKPVVLLTPTLYIEEKFMIDKTPIDSRTVSTEFIVNFPFSLREAFDSAASGKSIKRTLGQLVGDISELDACVPKPFSSRNAYITQLVVNGYYNDSLVSFYAGFSEFERRIYSYVNTRNPDVLDKDIVDRLRDADRDFFSMRIPPSKIVDGEGSIVDDDLMQRALDEQYERGEVHDIVEPPRGVCAHPSFRMLKAEIELFKGVTASTVKNIAVETLAKQMITAPISSLLVNTINEEQCVLIYDDKSDAGKFNVHADMLAHIPVSYAKTLRTALLQRADVIRRTCMHDVRDLQLAFLPTFVKENWSVVEDRPDERQHVNTGKIFHLDSRFNIRMKIAVEAVYVGVNPTSSAAFMVDSTPLAIKTVWRKQDVDRSTGRILHGAKPCYSLVDEVKDRQAKHSIERRDDCEGVENHAASSVAVDD